MSEDGKDWSVGMAVVGIFLGWLVFQARSCSVEHKTACVHAVEAMTEASPAEKALFIEACASHQ